jgi:hypothetical protein
MDQPADELGAALGRIIGRLLADPDVRSAIRAIGRMLSEAGKNEEDGRGESATGTHPAAETFESHSTQETTSEEVPEPNPQAASTRREPLRPLTLGQTRSGGSRVSLSTDFDHSDEPYDLEMISARCRIKADGIRWSVERRKRISAGEEFQERVAPGDREIVERARALPNCWIWMNNPQVPASSAIANDPSRASTLAFAFETCAACVEALHIAREEDAGAVLLAEALQWAAEAQSALRVLVEQFGYSKDNDQFELYSYLRQVGERHQIYIKRFMRLDDPADPARLPELRQRITDFSERLGRERGQSRDRRKLLSKLRYHGRILRDGTGSDADRRKVIETTSQLVASGMPPSSPQLREHLDPIFDDLATSAEVPSDFQLVLRELGSFREHVTERCLEAVNDEPPIPEVAEVATLLRGRSIVFICNVLNPDARDALIHAFELADLDWIVSREHQSIERFKPHIARSEVALVLLPIRWTSHSFGELKEYCDMLGKPFVQLPGGYSVNQVALQILNQASERLRGHLAPESVATV